MIFKRAQTYWYKFNWSVKQADGASNSFLIRRSARTKVPTEAEEVEREHRRALRLGEIHPQDAWPKPPTPDAPLLKEFTNRFLAYAKLHVKESSLEFYKRAVSRLLAFTDLANERISKINPEVVTRFVGSRQGVGISAINGDLRTLRRLLRLAFECEIIPRMPVVHQLPGERIRDRVLSFPEEEKYLAAAGANLRALTILAVDTGMCPNSELFRLEWAQVQLEGSELMPFGYLRIKQGKTQSAERVLPLTPAGQGSAPYIKDRAAEETLGLPRPGKFRASGKYPKIPSPRDPESRSRSVSFLLLAPHVRDQMYGERHGPTHSGQVDGP